MAKDYVRLDIERVSIRLAELWFEEFEKDFNPKELYDTYLEEGHGLHVVSTVKPEWSIRFWQKVEYYKELLTNYEK